MRLKLNNPTTNVNQLDFFSLFNLSNEDEESSTVIINNRVNYKKISDSESDAAIVNFVQQSESPLSILPGEIHAKSADQHLPCNAIIHKMTRASENDYLFRMPEYDADIDAAVFDWNSDSVLTIYIAAMEESFEFLRLMVLQKTLFFVNEDGAIEVNPILIAETRWYMSEVFELACAANGIDPIEFRLHLRDFLYNETHRYREMKEKKALYKSDQSMVFHDCSDGTDWDTFFDPDYFHSTRQLAIKWKDADVLTLFIKAFNETMNLFETLVVCNRITTTGTDGSVQVNPVFEVEFEWIQSDVFEIIGKHLGYDVAAVRKQIATVCKMQFH
jgi:hypothetical protein